MLFILLLIASAIAIAGSAAYFSVYGLANTFSGVFWSVVVMGASLEAGKLVAASYLYRHWKDTNVLLRSYMMAGILALMLLTSGGIFGYLSSGYQADVLPLKQMEAQTNLLEEEKTRKLDRKKQIDDLIAKVPAVTNVTREDGTVDPVAIRALAQTQRNRTSLVTQYKAEQQDLTKRTVEIDKELLELRRSVIKAEAHVGPITYIAKAFGTPTDNATKWLVFLIIFAFDPMAVALTLAVNVVLQLREEKEKAPLPAPFTGLFEDPANEQNRIHTQHLFSRAAVKKEPPVETIKEVIKEVPVPMEVIKEEVKEVPVEKVVEIKNKVPEYSGRWTEGTGTQEKIEMLLAYYRALNEKQKSGVPLTTTESRELMDIKNIFKRKGYDAYLND